MEQSVSMAEAKSKLADLVGQTAYGGKRFILKRRGQAMAVLIGMDEYRRLRALEEVEAKRQPWSPELRQRQEQLVDQARRLRTLLGDPIEGLGEILRTLPPKEDEFWLQVTEGTF